MGTGLYTVSATDTLDTVGIFKCFYIHITGFLTDTAGSAFLFINFVSVKRNLIKQTVYRTEWTEVTAEGSVNQ